MVRDTIAAPATAIGEAGIAIVRISGDDAFSVADTVFHPAKGRTLQDTPGYRLRYGHVVDPRTGRAVDEVLAAVMRAPHSFTGEHVVELQCHGGPKVSQRILDLVLQAGARMAEPGEFTKRAFLNGRMDLSQAEAVIDVIRSRTDSSLDVAVRQLEGSLRQRIQGFRETLLDLVVRVEASIDFPEDDIPDVEIDEMQRALASIRDAIQHLIDTAEEGKILREGFKAVITGKPNVGKSSLLNRLLDETRALVTDVPGTTRDVIEEVINVRGIPMRVLDTAGIRSTTDVVERLGVERARGLWDEADLIIHVLDASIPLSQEDWDILQQTAAKKRVIVVNKIDLPRAWPLEDLPLDASTKLVEMSLLEGELDSLLETVVQLVHGGLRFQSEEALITRSRHKQALHEALDDLAQAQTTLDQGLPVDLIAIGLQGALEHLGEITGETARDTVLERIFAQFCIGK